MLRVNQLNGFWVRRGVIGSWQTVLTVNIASASAGWNGYTFRQWFNFASYAVSGGTQIRATLKGPSGGNMVIDNCFIGHAAAAGDAYDFESSPTRLQFGGVNGITLTGGASSISDAVSFVLNPAKHLIISAHFSATTSLAFLTATANHQGYYKSAVSEAGTQNVSGYTTWASSGVVSKVEIFA